MAICSSIPACKIPWTEEAGVLQSTGSQRVRHNWETECSTYTLDLKPCSAQIPTLPRIDHRLWRLAFYVCAFLSAKSSLLTTILKLANSHLSLPRPSCPANPYWGLTQPFQVRHAALFTSRPVTPHMEDFGTQQTNQHHRGDRHRETADTIEGLAHPSLIKTQRRRFHHHPALPRRSTEGWIHSLKVTQTARRETSLLDSRSESFSVHAVGGGGTQSSGSPWLLCPRAYACEAYL